jgi:hypothetical protein
MVGEALVFTLADKLNDKLALGKTVVPVLGGGANRMNLALNFVTFGHIDALTAEMIELKGWDYRRIKCIFAPNLLLAAIKNSIEVVFINQTEDEHLQQSNDEVHGDVM